MLEKLKEQVLAANLELPKRGLITYTWGNVSGIDRVSGLVVIKPSGVEYEALKASDLPVVDLQGNQIEGSLAPSSDTPTHLALYRAYPQLGGITHTHSRWATIFAQAQRPIPAFGTTHADYFYGEISVTRELTAKEIQEHYEENTGNVICETFSGGDILAIPAVLVACHGPFTFGASAEKSVEAAVVLEEVAMMAYHTTLLERENGPVPQVLLDKHYHRKHGRNAYYGQKQEG